MFEEYESFHDRSGRRDTVMGQSIVLSEIKTETPLESDDPAYQNFLLQQYEERIERLSQPDKVSKFCIDAGFISVVESGQYFITKDTGEQIYAVACREYTLPRDDGSSQPRGWIQGNTKIGPVLEVATSCLYGKHGVEIRIWFLSEDSTHSWVRISHGSNKFVMDSNCDTEVLEDQPEEQALQLDAKDFVSQAKAKAKPQRREFAGSSSRIIPMERRNWIDSEYEVSKKVIHLLRHTQKVYREEDGAVHFWRIKENLQNQFPQSIHWSDDRWKACLAAGGGAKRRYQYCTDGSRMIVYLRALQGHSGRNLIDLSLQDNVTIQSGFFHHVYHIGCAFNLHSIINNGLILGGQNSSKRQTVFFLPFDPGDKSHKHPEKIDLSVPRRAQYLHYAWKKHQDAVYWVDIDLAIRKGLTFYQTRSNAIILQGTLPAYCIPKVVRLKTGEVLYEKTYMSPRPPPKISLRHDWTKELGSKVDRQPQGEVTRQPEGEVARQAKFFQPTQPNPNPIRDRSGRPGKDTVAVQDDPEVYHEAETLNIDNETIRERIEADMDFKIPGLPHSIVKHAQSDSVRELIQKIENQTNRHALQRDLRQNQSFNPFSPESKQMIRDVGNIELCELLEPEPKALCNVCLSNWDIGIVYCTCGHFLHKERGTNQEFIKYTMDLLSIPDCVIKKGCLHGHRYGKKPGDREYCTANQLKKKSKKKFFQGIHDRFIRDEQFRNRMIEPDRDEDACRQMDALAGRQSYPPFDPTRIFLSQKVIGGFVRTRQVPILCLVQRRSHFRQTLSTLQQMKRKSPWRRTKY